MLAVYWALSSVFFWGEGKRQGTGAVIYGKKARRRIRRGRKDDSMSLEMVRDGIS